MYSRQVEADVAAVLVISFEDWCVTERVRQSQAKIIAVDHNLLVSVDLHGEDGTNQQRDVGKAKAV